MQEYTGFAQVYDTFMDNVPYEEWANYLTGLLKEYGVLKGLVLELGCGTGNITRHLAVKGYDMIGIDSSQEMLGIAREKEYKACSYDELEDNIEDGALEDQEEKNSILYLQQDMRSFELYGTVAAVVSICDSMNYITSKEELLSVFKLVNNYLDPGGIFIFDMNTEYKYKNILSDNTIAENRDDCSFIWENYYDEENKMNEYNVTIFVKLEEELEELEELEKLEKPEELEEDSQEKGDEMKNHPQEIFERFMETHYQMAYSIDTVKNLLETAGLEFVAVFDAFTRELPTGCSERVYYVAREKYQKNKKYVTD